MSDIRTTTGPDDETPTARPCHGCGAGLAVYEPQVCGPCHGTLRGHLYDILDLYATLPDHLAVLSGATPGHTPSRDTHLPGGAALVMLSPGSEGRSETAHTLRVEDPPSVVEVLTRWEDDIRRLRGEAAGVSPHDRAVSTAANYLLTRSKWAANRHPAWREYAQDLVKLRSRLRVVTGDIRTPVRAPAPCLVCGGILERRWRDDGLEDTWKCVDCDLTYDPRQYILATKAHLIWQAREAG